MALILSHHHELILLGILLRNGLRRVVELVEDVLISLCLRESATGQLLTQIVAEGFCRGQEHTSVTHRIAFDEVEIAVRVYLIIIVQTVTAQHLQQRTVLHPGVRDIGQIYTCRIALVLDVQAELGLLYRRGQIVDVLHHQVPVALGRIVRSVLQRLHKQGLSRLGIVAGKFSHLIGLTACRKLIGYRQHLIGLKTRLQRDIAE